MKEKEMAKISSPNEKSAVTQNLIISCFQFRKIRIKHMLLIFSLFFTRTFLATILNLLIISNQELSLVHNFERLWYSLSHLISSFNSIAFYVAVPSSCIIILLSIIFFAFNQRLEIKKIGLGFVSIYHYFSPFFLRFVIMITLRASANYSPFFGILGLFYIFLNFVSEFFFCLISANSNPKNENHLTRQHKTAVIIKEISESLMVIIFEIFTFYGFSKEAKIVFLLFQAFLCLLPIKVLCVDFVYHNQSVENLFIFYSCFEFTSFILYLIREFIQSSFYQENFIFLICAFTFFLFISFKNFVQFRNNQIEVNSKSFSSGTNKLNIYLHVLANSLENPNNENKLWFLSNLFKKEHKEACTKLDCICKNNHISHQRDKEFEHSLIKNKIKNICQFATSNFEQTLFCSYINLTYFEAFPDLLLNLSNVIKKKELSWFENLQYLSLKKEIEHFLTVKRNKMNGVQIELVQKQDQLILTLLNNFEEISNVKLNFWANLNKPQPNLKTIEETAYKEMGIKSKIESQIEQCINIYSFSNALMEILCLYEVYIQLAPKLPKYLLESQQRTALARSEKIKVLKTRNFRIDIVMYEKYCVMFESQIEKNKMGIILNVSKNITKVFGFVKEDIIGKNINEIMPKSMQKEHDNILESWRERASWEYVHKIRFILAMTKENVCFESVIYLTIIQRTDSINLFALFVKANENSYMIVNDEGNIDGAGRDFIDIFGNRVAKLPLNYVCKEAKEIIEKAQKNEVETMEISVFHVKGLEREIDIYQHSKYQMKYKNQYSETLLLEQIQTHERHLNLKIECKPYMMGSKRFVLLRLIEAMPIESPDEPSLNENITHSFRNVESYEVNKNVTNMNILQNQQINRPMMDIDREDQTASISSTINDDGVAWEKIIEHLQTRTKNKSKFRNQKFEAFFLTILFVCLFAIVILIVENEISSAKYEEMREYTKRGTRFMYIMESFTLAHTRAQNIELFKQGMNSSMIKNVVYQISRLNVELVRIEMSLYLKDFGLVNIDELMPNKKIKWKGSESFDVEISIHEYYSFYLQEFKELKQSLIKKTNLASLKSMVKNYRNMIQFIGRNLEILDDRIYSVLTEIIIIECIKYVLLEILIFVSIILLWRSKIIEEKQKEAIHKIVLTISDKNCQTCSIYFRKILFTIVKCQAYSQTTENSAEFVMKYLVEETKLENHLKELIIHKDQIEKNKFMNLQTNRTPKIKLFLVFMAALFTLQISLSSGIRLNFLMKNRQFYRFYIKLIQKENSNFEQFEYLKTFLFSETSTTLEYEEISNMLEHSLNSQASNNYFINLFVLLQEISTPNDLLLPFLQNKINLCSLTKQIDQIFFKEWCNSNSSYPFNRLSLIEINTMIENYIRQMLSLLISAKSLDKDSEQLIFIVEEALTLKISYFYQFSLTLSAWANEVYAENKSNESIYRTVLIIMLSVFIIICHNLEKKMGESLLESYSIILVLPETVLKRTKRAMKHISDLIK